MNFTFDRKHALSVAVVAAWLIALCPAAPTWAQPAADPAHAAHAAAATDAASLAKQIAELRDKVTRLEYALQKGQPVGSGTSMQGMDSMSGTTGGSMKGMDAMGSNKGGMGMMDMDMMEMMGMMGMAPKSAGGMSGMKSMGAMQMKAALPSFPGASHIYHIGASDFFLNHPEHIDLTSKQRGDLARIKEKAILAKASAQRKIDEAEQELWILTSADGPDAAKIESKIREIEVLRGDQRMALIRAVGDAAKLLTDEQRQALLGTGTDKTDKVDKAAKPDPHADHKP